MELSKNKMITLDITGTTAEGSGIGRAESSGEDGGMAVIVPFTAVGDRIRCRILKVEKRLAYGRAEEILISSGDRIAAARRLPGVRSLRADAPGGMSPMRRNCGISSERWPTP